MRCPQCDHEFIRTYDLVKEYDELKYEDNVGTGNVDDELIKHFPFLKKYKGNTFIADDFVASINVMCPECCERHKIVKRLISEYIVITDQANYSKLMFLYDAYGYTYGDTYLNLDTYESVKLARIG